MWHTFRLNMAECTMDTDVSDINLLKSTKIMVYVEEALEDVLVVSYVFDSKFFQGILLDSTKRRIPAGITLPASQTKVPMKGTTEEDLLCKAINQRFTYFQDISFNGAKWNSKRTKNGKIKNTRMNVRLRPRQVLCSKCRSICNENSENVDHSATKASGDQPGSKLAVAVENSRRSLRLSATIEKSPRPLLYESFKNHQMKTRGSEETPTMLTPSLVPKLSRLQPNEITSALNGKYSPKLSLLNGNCCLKSVIASPKSESSENKYCVTDVDQEFDVSLPETGNIPQKSAVDMEVARTLTVLDVASTTSSTFANAVSSNSGCATTMSMSTTTTTSSITTNAATSEMDGKMVLRKKHSIGSMEDLWDESIFEDQMLKTKTTPVLKISFGTEGQGTVLKIPAKVTNNSSGSDRDDDEDDDGHMETRSMLKAARKAHKKAKKEAKKRMIATASPARSPAYENFFSHRSRHKIKRKRKHKYPRAIVAASVTPPPQPSLSPSSPVGEKCGDSDAEKGKNEKLSISFKRLDGNAYTATRNESPNASPNGAVSEEDGDCVEAADSEPLEAEMTACGEGYTHKTKNGRTIVVGDVVWAKTAGLSWWPGKVLSFKTSTNEHNKIYAYISWFGSLAPSLISCDNVCTFSDNYKLRFNKQSKSGQYKEAVKTATSEAKKKRGIPIRSSRGSTGSPGSTNSSGGQRCF